MLARGYESSTFYRQWKKIVEPNGRNTGSLSYILPKENDIVINATSGDRDRDRDRDRDDTWGRRGGDRRDDRGGRDDDTWGRRDRRDDRGLRDRDDRGPRDRDDRDRGRSFGI